MAMITDALTLVATAQRYPYGTRFRIYGTCVRNNSWFERCRDHVATDLSGVKADIVARGCRLEMFSARYEPFKCDICDALGQ